MKDESITFETAKAAKEKGFWVDSNKFQKGDAVGSWVNFTTHIGYAKIRESYFNDYPEHLIYCSQSLLQRWLREVHNIDIEIKRSFSMIKSYHYYLYQDGNDENGVQQSVQPNRPYEEALEAGLLHALTLI